MAQLPKLITITKQDWEGYTLDKFQEEFIEELVEKFNELLAYLAEQEEEDTPHE